MRSNGMGSIAYIDPATGKVVVENTFSKPYDYSTATTLDKDLYTVFSPTGVVPAGDIVPSAWLPGVSPTWLPGLSKTRPAVLPAKKSAMPMLALAGAGILAAFFFLKRR